MDTLEDRRYAGAYSRDELATRKEIADIMIDVVGEMDRGKKVWAISREIIFGPIGLSFHWRSGNRVMGRFGAGWNWALGIKASRKAVLLNLLVFSIQIFFGCKNGDR